MANSPQLNLCARQCGQCLLSRGRIVSGERAAEIIKQCRAEDTNFQCHKGSIAGVENLHCRGFHDRWPSRAYRFAVQFGIPVVELDPEEL